MADQVRDVDPGAAQVVPHFLVLSFPMQGHINPLMQLCFKLASSGLAITFALSEYFCAHYKNVQKKNEQNSKRTEEEEQESSVYGVPGKVKLIGVPDHLGSRTAGSEFRDSYDSLVNMKDGVELMLQKMQASAMAGSGFCKNKVTFIMADTFVDWAHSMSSRFQLPLISFFTSNAASSLVFLHAPSLKEKGILPFRDEKDNLIVKEHVTEIPGLTRLHPLDFPLCFTFGPSHYRYQFVLGHHRNFHHSSAVIMNTVDGLEQKALEALRKTVSALTIGPLLLQLSDVDAPLDGINPNYWPEDLYCLKWLDSQKPSSVIYVSFGSTSIMSRTQIVELALGLESSQQPFLWVIRPDSIPGSLESSLPDGFLSRIGSQGLIISWAPQLAVLRHPSVGVFLTHCGWNSTMENLSIRGIPTICWPCIAEQRMNCRIFVDEWRTGIEAIKDENGVVSKEEVERVVRAAMQDEEGNELRERAAHMQEIAKKAMSKEGSSVLNYKALVNACFSNSFEVGKRLQQ